MHTYWPTMCYAASNLMPFSPVVFSHLLFAYSYRLERILVLPVVVVAMF